MTKDWLRLAGLLTAVAQRRSLRVLRAPQRFATSRRTAGPDRLLIAPQDIRTSDPTVAADIYDGYFTFAGKSVVVSAGGSPFAIEAGSSLWARELSGFGWLRHLRAEGTPMARSRARELVADFVKSAGRPRATAVAWDAVVAARRLLSWLSQSPLILDGGDRAFYHRFMRAIGRTQAFLEAQMQGRLEGEARLLAAIALATLGLSANGAGLQKRGSRRLADELDVQILRDGGSVSRNPQSLIDLLLDLLPLRQAYAARGIAPPPQLLNAVDRMIPMLRLFRHADGSLALFNGMGNTQQSQLATILAYDDTRAAAVLNAPASGYQRVEASGGAVLVVDAGVPPPPLFSSAAHAGCLSFEFSAGGECLIVNCGHPAPGRAAADAAARSTAAHSTLVVADTSSCRFADQAGLARWLGRQIVSGPTRVETARRIVPEGTALDMRHNGYQERFGLLHARTLTFDDGGGRLAGIDVLQRTGRVARDARYALRFHLHPDVRPRPQAEHGRVQLDTRRGAWLFSCADAPISIEDSIYFAGPQGPQSTSQIVIQASTAQTMQLAWAFERLDG